MNDDICTQVILSKDGVVNSKSSVENAALTIFVESEAEDIDRISA